MKSRNPGSVAGTLALLLVACATCGCGGGSASASGGGGGMLVPATLSGTITAGISPVAVAVDPTANKVYVANYGNNVQSLTTACSPTGGNVTVIDGAAESTSTITNGIGFTSVNPAAVAVDPANQGVYLVVAANFPGFDTRSNCPYQSWYLTAISGATFDLAGFPVGLVGTSTPVAVSVNLLTDKIYAAYGLLNNGSGNNLAVIDGSNNALIGGLKLAGVPTELAVDPTTNKIYVALGGEIDVIDGATNSLTKVAVVSAAGRNSVAVNTSTNTIYVVNSQSDNLTVLDGATGSVTATISVGTSPSGVDVDSRTNFIYVANAGNSQTGDAGSVTVINGSTNATATLVDSKATNPVAVAVNSATHKVYVANKGSNNVTVIDGAHH